ncbi:MAG: F0F1-type synthase, alpha subunit [Clostridiales bacterium]|nr:F0F1-type synthase, alpha subunit [Clostridiales bacterium]
MEELNKELDIVVKSHHLFNIPLFGYEIPVSDTIVVMWIIMAILILFAFIFTRNMKIIPNGRQKFVEVLVETINNLAKDAIGHHWRHFAPYIGTILLFLILANIISVFNIIPNFEQLYKITGIEAFENLPHLALYPPTKNLNVPAAMAVMSIVLILFAGMRFKGIKGWLKSFIEPVPFLLPFKILEYGIKPLSLCLRLFGNILAAFIIMELVYFAFPMIVPGVLSIYFDLFDGILQAYVFVFLTSLFIGEAVEEE